MFKLWFWKITIKFRDWYDEWGLWKINKDLKRCLDFNYDKEYQDYILYAKKNDAKLISKEDFIIVANDFMNDLINDLLDNKQEIIEMIKQEIKEKSRDKYNNFLTDYVFKSFIILLLAAFVSFIFNGNSIILDIWINIILHFGMALVGYIIITIKENKEIKNEVYKLNEKIEKIEKKLKKSDIKLIKSNTNVKTQAKEDELTKLIEHYLKKSKRS